MEESHDGRMNEGGPTEVHLKQPSTCSVSEFERLCHRCVVRCRAELELIFYTMTTLSCTGDGSQHGSSNPEFQVETAVWAQQ